MYYTFIFIYLVYHPAYPEVNEDLFGVIPIGIFLSPYGVILRMYNVS